ncbi:hypothetical protein SLS62_006440 [Diatrype stigma]|uniref:Uncharacterized protein n=1 Tax=Diatrype stigma TaxID=117547 RepID=A0AAN9UML6_9PEZI
METSSTSSNNPSSSEASSNRRRFGPLANSSNSSTTDRNVRSTSTGGERPCDTTATPAAAAAAPYEDKRPVDVDVDAARDGVNSTPVIRERRPEPGETGEQQQQPPAEAGRSKDNHHHHHGRKDDEEALPCNTNTNTGEEGEGGEEERILSEIESGILDVFSDAYCNKHLVYGVLELILVRLMPELAEKGIVELWKERLD